MSAPEFKVGDAVIVERRFGFQPLSDPPRSSYETKIVRETPTRWILDGRHGWIKKGETTVMPRYLDDRTDARLKDET